MSEIISLFEELKAIPGLPGGEGRVRDTVAEILADSGEQATDAIGNLILHIPGSGKRVMVTAPLDAPGVVVTHIAGNMIRLDAVGELKPELYRGARVALPDLTGFVQFEGDAKWENAYLDLPYPKDETPPLVAGHSFPFDAPTVVQHGHLVSPQVGTRMLTALLTKAARSVQNSSNDLYLVFTAQRCLGGRGAQTAASAVRPDMLLTLEAVPTEHPVKHDDDISLGAGAVKILESGAMLMSPTVSAWLDTAAKAVTPAPLVHGIKGGDATAHTRDGGCAVGSLGLPVRYPGSMTEQCALSDCEAVLKLLAAALETTF